MKHLFGFGPNGKLLLVLLCLCFSFPSVHASLPYCDSVFSNAVQTFGPGSYVHFDYNAQLVNPSSTDLNTGSVSNHPWSQRVSCATAPCNATATELERLSDDRELQTNSAVEIVIPPKKKITVGDNDTHQFGRVAVSEWATAVFSERHDVYVIDRLHVGYKSSLRLPAGEYWVRDLRLEVESRIDVIGEGKVSLYVIDSLLVPFNVKINENTKNAAQMTIYTYSAAEFYVGSQTYAFLRTDNEVFLHHRARITGGVLAQFVDLRTESQIIYNPAAAQALDFTNICRSSTGTVEDTTPPEIIDTIWYEEPNSNRASFTAIVRDVGENASGIATVFIRTATEDLAMDVNGDTYTIDLRLVPGENHYTLIARDQAGNESTVPTGTYFSSVPEFFNITYPETTTEPFALITGEVHTYWSEENLTLLVGDESVNLIPVDDGVYRFEVNYPLPVWYNRFDISLTSPDGYLEHRASIFYHPAELYVTLDQEDVQTDAETITLTGTFGIPGPQHNIQWHNLVVTGEHLPNEIPVVIEEVTDSWGHFSVEVPLVYGPNYFSVRVINTPGEVPWEGGTTITRIPVPE